MTTNKQCTKFGRKHKVYHEITLQVISDFTGLNITTIYNKIRRKEIDLEDLDSCIKFMLSYKWLAAGRDVSS